MTYSKYHWAGVLGGVKREAELTIHLCLLPGGERAGVCCDGLHLQTVSYSTFALLQIVVRNFVQNNAFNS